MDDFDFDSDDEDEEREPEPTSAERLLYALGQLYRRWHNCELPVGPIDFDVMDLATTIGVKRDIEMVCDHPHATAYHFAGEVLVATDDRFPWCLMTVEAWSAWCELEDYSREFGLD